MSPPIEIDGTDITGATIDGQDVTEITVDGQTVFTGVRDIYQPLSDTKDNFSGATSDWTITNNEATIPNHFEINSDLVFWVPSSGGYIYSSAGLSNYPEYGDNFSIYHYEDGGNRNLIATYFFAKLDGTRDGYGLYLRDGQGDAQITKWNDGNENRLVRSDFGLNADEWFDHEIRTTYDSSADELTIVEEVFEVNQTTGERTNSMGQHQATDTNPYPSTQTAVGMETRSTGSGAGLFWHRLV